MKHKCILSCGICLKEHREILNRHDRVLEFLDLDMDISAEEKVHEIENVIRGESH